LIAETDDQVLAAVPAGYTLGDRVTYLVALQRSRPGYSRDGRIPPRAAQALFEVLRRFDPAVKSRPDLDVSATYDNRFVEAVKLP
jgi:NitT/TauT family transport system substrate-binding protein